MRIRRALVGAITATALTAGVALAVNESRDLKSYLLAPGGWDRGDRTEFLAALAAQGRTAESEVVVVRATLLPDGYTYWHGHNGPSVVVVTAGELTVLEPTPNGGCTTEEYAVGDAFFHTAGNHDFRNMGDETTEFYITYFVPSWPPVTHPGDPRTC